MDIVDRLFVAMFDSLNENCQKELEAIGRQYPFEPLKVTISDWSFDPMVFCMLNFSYTISLAILENKELLLLSN